MLCIKTFPQLLGQINLNRTIKVERIDIGALFSFIPLRLALSAKLMRNIAVSIVAALALASSGFAEGKKSPFIGGPRTIASRERVTVLIDREITDGKKFIVLKISVPTDSQVKAFLLPDPPRVVVDFEGASIKKSEEFTAPDNEVIKQVRLGAHPSKIRFVLDMKRSTPPEYEWKAGKRQAIFKFFEGQAETSAPAAPSAAPSTIPTSAPTATPPNAALPTQPPPTAPTIAPTMPPTIAPTTAPTIAPSHTPTLQPTSQPTMTPSATPKTTLSDVEPKIAASAPTATLPVPAIPADQAKQAAPD